MKAQETEHRSRRSWLPRGTRGRATGSTGTVSGVLERTMVLVRHLERRAGAEALQPLLTALEEVRGVRAQRLRLSILELRERIAAIHAAVEAGTAVPQETLGRVREIEGRLHEAHWLSRQAAQRATAAAMDLQRMCMVTSDMGDFVDLLRGLGDEAPQPGRRRSIAA